MLVVFNENTIDILIKKGDVCTELFIDTDKITNADICYGYKESGDFIINFRILESDVYRLFNRVSKGEFDVEQDLVAKKDISIKLKNLSKDNRINNYIKGAEVHGTGKDDLLDVFMISNKNEGGTAFSIK